MNRSALPTADCTDADSLPLVACPVPEPRTYTYDVRGEWFEDFFGYGETLLLGSVDPLVPEPDSLTMDTYLHVLTEEMPELPPQADDVPTSWQMIGSQVVDPTQPVSAVLPLVVIPIVSGQPFWMMYEFTDDQGCVTTAVAFLADGLPESWLDDVSLYVSIAGRDFELMEVPGGGGPSDLIPIEDQAGVCPPAPQAVAVTPACGVPFPVAFEGPLDVEFPDSLEVTGPAGGPVPVTGPGGDPVATSSAPVGLLATIYDVDTSAGSPSNVVVPAGAVMVTLAGVGDTGAKLRLNPGGIDLQQLASGSFETFVLSAPAGYTLPAITVTVEQTGAGDTYGTAAAYTPA